MKNVSKIIVLFGFFTVLITSTTWAMRPDFQQQLKERRERLEKERQEKLTQENAQNQTPTPQLEVQDQNIIQHQFTFDEDIEVIFKKYLPDNVLLNSNNNNNNVVTKQDSDTNTIDTDDLMLEEETIIPNSKSNQKKRKRNQGDELQHEVIKKSKIPASEVQLDKLYNQSMVIKYFPHNMHLKTEKYTVNKEILEQLINSDNLDISFGSSNQTALHYAVCYLDLQTVECLIHAGANVNARDSQGQTPLHFCAKQDNLVWGARTLPGNTTTIKNLLYCGGIALPSKETSEKRTQIIDALRRGGADLNAQDNQGSTPLALIISNILNDRNNDEEFKNLLHTIESLLQEGAYLSIPSDHLIAEYTPGSIEGIKRKNALINLLLKYNVSFDQECKKLMVNAWSAFFLLNHQESK
jgi:hypothetical protein